VSRIVSDLIYRLQLEQEELTKGLKKASVDVEALSKKFTETGKKLTLGLTVPIIGAGAAMIKLASDTGESLNAASVVFKESTKVIEEWGKNAAEQAGLTSAEFYQASAVIGAGLINAGASADTAADQTIELTKRAADMASIFNTDVNDALLALQSGLRGESEPLRRFAISLDEASVNARATAMGLVDAEGEVTAYGKSQARLALIMEQSAGFQGDFVNTSDQLANGTRIVTARIKEEAAELGQQLLPLVLKVVQGVGGLVDKFADLSDEQKQAILITAGVAAAIGPMLIGVGNAIKAVNTLGDAFKKLSLAGGGPAAIAIAAIAAISLAAVAMATNIKKAQEEYAELKKVLTGGTTGDVAEDLELIGNEIDNIKAKIAGSTGLFPDEDARLQAELTTAISIQDKLQDKLIKQEQIQRSQTKIAEDASSEAASHALTTEELRAQQAITDKYKSARETVLDILHGEKSEYDQIQGQIDTLSSTPWATGKLETDRLAAIEILRARQIAILDEKSKADADARGDAIVADALANDQKLANEQRINDQRIADERRVLNERMAYAQQFASQLSTIYSQITSNQLDELDQQYSAEKARIEANITDEAEKTAALEALEKKLAYEKAVIQRKQAIADKAQSLFSIGLSIPTSMAKAMELDPTGILATIVGIFTAAQMAAVIAQPLPEIPSFARGGSFIVPPGFDNDSFALPAAMVQSGERVTVETPEQQSASREIHLHVGTLVADKAGLRELDRRLRDVQSTETARRGSNG
jgi:hypothetical protein